MQFREPRLLVGGDPLARPKVETGVVNRAQLQQLAEDRILDAECLLAGVRWGGAYYLAGSAVECGLKACIMAHVEAVGSIFQDKKFSEKCWTHDLEDLLRLANLKPALDANATTNAELVRQLDHGQGLDGNEPLRAKNAV